MNGKPVESLGRVFLPASWVRVVRLRQRLQLQRLSLLAPRRPPSLARPLRLPVLFEEFYFRQDISDGDQFEVRGRWYRKSSRHC
jgi:hypothetical protein